MPLFLLYTALLLFAFFFPKSKHLTVALGIFMWLMYGFAWYEGDLEVYQWVYSEIQSGAFNKAYEPLFIAAMWICSKLGMGFTVFRLVLGGFIVLSVYFAIKGMTENTAAAMGLYGVFPFFVFISVMRTGVASALVMLAVAELIKTNPNKMKFILLIGIATLFHYSSFVFMILLLGPEVFDRKYMVAVIIGSLFLSIVINRTGLLYGVLSKITSRQKVLQWFTDNGASANLKGILAEVIVIASLFVMMKRNNIIGVTPAYTAIEGYSYNAGVRVNHLAYKLCGMMILLLPLMIYASPFMRLPYMVFPVFVMSTLNSSGADICLEQEVGYSSGRFMVKMGWFVLLLIVLMWKLYYDLPYLKAGSHLFSEFFDLTFR